MKNCISCIILFLIPALGLLAQVSVERHVSASGSFTFVDNELGITSTFGQAIVGTLFNGNQGITQGFQQPTSSELGTWIENLHPDYTYALYPNPASGRLWYRYTYTQYPDLELAMMDCVGRQVISGIHTSSGQLKSIDISGLASGYYTLLLVSNDNRVAIPHPVIIQNQ